MAIVSITAAAAATTTGISCSSSDLLPRDSRNMITNIYGIFLAPIENFSIHASATPIIVRWTGGSEIDSVRTPLCDETRSC